MIKRYMFLFIFLLTGVSYGETVEQLIDYAVKNSPQIKAQLYEVEALSGDIKSAEAIPNPEAYIQFGRLYSQSESGLNLTEISIYQPLRLWNTRKNSVEEALLRKSAFEFMFDYYKNQVAGEVYKRFYEALYYRELLRIKEENLSIVNSVYQFVKKNYELGEETKLNLFRAEKDLKIAQLEVDQVKTEYQIKLKELSSIVGKDVFDLEGDIKNIKDMKEFQIDQLPEIKYLQKLKESVEKAILVQRGLAKPQVGLELIAGEDAAELGKYEFGIGISTTIPVFYKNEGEIIKLSGTKNSIVQKIKQKELIYRTKIDGLKKKYSVLRSQLEDVNGQIIPSLSDALNLGRKSFRLRVITLFELSDIRKQYIEALIYKAQLLRDIHQVYGEYIKIGGIQ
ncbi:TolC family protein [Persephonella sp.]